MRPCIWVARTLAMIKWTICSDVSETVTASALLMRRWGKHWRGICFVRHRFRFSKQWDGASLSKPLRKIEWLAGHCDARRLLSSRSMLQCYNYSLKAATNKQHPQYRQQYQKFAITTATTARNNSHYTSNVNATPTTKDNYRWQQQSSTANNSQ